MKSAVAADQPLFFEPNRVWRCYTGGRLLDQYVGNPNPRDDYFPEDWLASTTRALNGEHSQGPDEGLSRVKTSGGEAAPGPLLADLIAADPAGFLGRPEGGELGVLCKFLDSAIRLPIQCHPDRAFARRHYRSEHGKAESWIILDSRRIEGEEPYLLMGFKPGVSEAEFAEAVRVQDAARLAEMLHRVPARPGDAWFIPGRFPHAIGPGVFLLEVQEPTDWVVHAERHCAGTRLSDEAMWGPLDPPTALACFDYRGEDVATIASRLRVTPVARAALPNATLETRIGPKTTDCFHVERLTLRGGYELRADPPACRIAVVTAGEGELEANGRRYPLRRGAVALLPYRLQHCTLAPRGNLELHLIRTGVTH